MKSLNFGSFIVFTFNLLDSLFSSTFLILFTMVGIPIDNQNKNISCGVDLYAVDCYWSVSLAFRRLNLPLRVRPGRQHVYLCGEHVSTVYDFPDVDSFNLFTRTRWPTSWCLFTPRPTPVYPVFVFSVLRPPPLRTQRK